MIRLSPKFISSLMILITTIGFTTNTSAQAVVTYGSGSSPIPTLGGVALIALSALLLIVAVWVLRGQKHAGANLVAVVTAVSALAVGIGGIEVISDADAVTPTIVLDSESGGQVQVPPGMSDIVNGTTRVQSILSIDPEPGCSIGDPRNGGIDGGDSKTANGGIDLGTCSDNPSTVMNPQDFCDIYVFCDDQS